MGYLLFLWMGAWDLVVKEKSKETRVTKVSEETEDAES